MHPVMAEFPEFQRVLAFEFFASLPNDGNDGRWRKLAGFLSNGEPCTYPVCPLGAVLRMYGERDALLFPSAGRIVRRRLVDLVPSFNESEDFADYAQAFISLWDGATERTPAEEYALLAELMGVPNTRAKTVL